MAALPLPQSRFLTTMFMLKIIVVHKGRLISSGATREEQAAADDFQTNLRKYLATTLQVKEFSSYT